jgi:hypothetical protein
MGREKVHWRHEQKVLTAKRGGDDDARERDEVDTREMESKKTKTK